MKNRIHPYLTRQYMLSNDFEIYHYIDKALDKVNLHHHDFYECYLFISGDVTYLIEGKTYVLRPGDVVLVNSTELHQAIINNKQIPYERIVLWIDKSFLSRLSTETTDLTKCFEYPEKENVLRADLEMQQTIKSMFKKLLALEDYTGIGRELLYKAYMIDLMVHLNILLDRSKIKPNVDLKNSNLISQVIHYINNHLEEEISIETLSEQFYLSKFHLIREFKKHTGTTIHKYIIQKKLIQAKEQILKGLPINIVYIQCGFGDYSNFFRAFKNEYGVTPKQFYDMMLKSTL
ncbi:MAG: AraC family transcriptional regulator [Clostridia bacterium]|nr:AraC family transcriptional regulator [Clostridia bacterium]